MNLSRRALATGALITAGALAAPAFAQSAPRLTARQRFEADRRAILAMAGDYHVRFDMRETVPFLDDYDPLEPHVSGGDEIVRVVGDTGELIQLQHTLCMQMGDQVVIVKHWRQDWAFEPRSVLAYERADTWRVEDVVRADRAGAWAQTVWNTDDAPRYGGVGRWRHEDGVSAWTSAPTLRPLARRDAVRNPPYTHMRGVNRHALTPTGWVHEQDNAKIGVRNGASATFVHESVINTYNRAADFPIAAGEAYWSSTASYWAAVRAEWDRVVRLNGGITLEESAESGSATGPRLMGLADAIHAGTRQTADASREAREVIASATAGARGA